MARPRNTYVCHACGHSTTAWAAMERHLDQQHHGGGRVDIVPPVTGSCEDDCQDVCAHPGQFSECDL